MASVSCRATSFTRPQPQEKKGRRKLSSKVGEILQPSSSKAILAGPYIMALDEEEIEDDVETISLQRKKRDKTQRVYLGETKRLFQEFELAEIVDSPF